MKALQDLTNTEKARLLYDLFPAEIPLFLDDLTKVCEDLKVRKEAYLKEWECSFINFDYWFSLAENTADILKRQTFNMKKSSKVFSDQLFFMDTSFFVNDRIAKYADRRSKNEKFKIAVNLLYYP
ncbi:hypothetical protein DBR43_03650 [Pedobacter sp. KBW06]|uniref:hypothetical protein n=1 Tax=Pedobacter sp. KBW06 TaxID=2153359 RepID=UPI000F59C1F9|nr:hypothetical protein [Pedobacter sp. KBW06]RQO75777.1 hypothetical protein DBR43_03650 [Pedobacter sp. KBW06]